MARYSPDPKKPLINTTLVSIDLSDGKQTALFENPYPCSEEVYSPLEVVDYPVWVDENSVLFLRIIYNDPEQLRLTSSSLNRFDFRTNGLEKIAGGESGFDAEGKSTGYKAFHPEFSEKKITFSAAEGEERRPMLMAPDGKSIEPMPVKDQEYFGPVFFLGGEIFYGTRNAEEKIGLAFQNSKGEKKQLLQNLQYEFDPVLIP